MGLLDGTGLGAEVGKRTRPAVRAVASDRAHAVLGAPAAVVAVAIVTGRARVVAEIADVDVAVTAHVVAVSAISVDGAEAVLGAWPTVIAVPIAGS